MDDQRFDAIAKALGTGIGRRGLLRRALGAALGIAVGERGAGAQTADCRGTGKRCGGGRAPCCSGVCKGKRGNKTCRCPQRNCCQCQSGSTLTSCTLARGIDLFECGALCAEQGGTAAFVAEASFDVTTACDADNVCTHVFCEPQETP